MVRVAACALACMLAVWCAGCAARPVAACSAGRCGSEREAPLLAKSRRFVLDPTDIAVIQRRREAASLPESVTLGRAGDGPVAILVRFDVPRELDVLDAYLIVERADAAPDGAGVGLHVERIASSWNGASVTWVDGPELHDPRAASVVLRAGGPARVRLDARFVKSLSRSELEHGLAVVADRTTAAGVAIAVTPTSTAPLVGDPPHEGGVAARASGPHLELYVK